MEESGGRANRFVVYEAKEVPILNPKKLTEKKAKEITNRLRAMEKQNQIEDSDLDKSVLAPLSLEDYAEEISK